jgi:hypothetical protein
MIPDSILMIADVADCRGSKRPERNYKEKTRMLFKGRSNRSRSQSRRRRRKQAIDMNITRWIGSGARRADKQLAEKE